MDNELSCLLRRASQGDERAFSDFVSSFQGKLLDYYRGRLRSDQDAEDARQKVLLRVFTSLRYYDSNLPAAPWVWRIASRVLADFLQLYSRQTAFVSVDALKHLASPMTREVRWVE